MVEDDYNHKIEKLAATVDKLATTIEKLTDGYVITPLPPGYQTTFQEDFQVPKGPLQIQKRGDYYNHDRMIATAGPVDPINPDSLVYNREEIFNNIGHQNAEYLQVVNRGSDDLFVRETHFGTKNFNDETIIEPGDTKFYYNIYELRLRSPTSGLLYTVTEFDVEKVCCPTVRTSVSGNLVQISGQAVVTDSGSVTSVSGDIIQVENASGQSLSVFICCSSIAVDVSGQIVEISGQAVVTDSGSVTSVSGDILQVTNASGLPLSVDISGVTVTLSSGTTFTVNVSGQIVGIESGSFVSISGQDVYTNSGSVTSVSGNIVTTASGSATLTISGSITSVSGDIVVINSGLFVSISGQIVGITSGSFVSISGQIVGITSGSFVSISGQGIAVASGLFVSISGQIVGITSGSFVSISGQGVTTTLASPTQVVNTSANPLAITGNSGGVALSSGVVVSVIMKSLTTNSGDIYIGGSGTGTLLPFSGFGFILSQGETISFDINNLNAIFVCAAISGDKISYMATR